MPMNFEQAVARLAFLAGHKPHTAQYSRANYSGRPVATCYLWIDGEQGQGATWEIAFADLAANMAGPDPTEAPDAEGGAA